MSYQQTALLVQRQEEFRRGMLVHSGDHQCSGKSVEINGDTFGLLLTTESVDVLVSSRCYMRYGAVQGEAF